jgi:hypothetical protein
MHELRVAKLLETELLFGRVRGRTSERVWRMILPGKIFCNFFSEFDPILEAEKGFDGTEASQQKGTHRDS